MSKQDKYGILKHSTEIMQKLTYESRMIKKEECGERLNKLDREYKVALREMFAYIRQTINSAEVKTADDLVLAFRDSCHAIGGLMLRAEMIAQPLIVKPVSDRANFAKAIRCDSNYSIMDDLGDILSDCGFGCGSTPANDAAYKAFDYSTQREDAGVIAAFPLIAYMAKKGIDANHNRLYSLFWESSCVDAVVKAAPVWAKRHPLLGYVEKWNADEDDGVVCPRDNSGFGCCGMDASDLTQYTIKPEPLFIEIFSDRLTRFYDAAEIGNADYYTVLELRRTTHKLALSMFAEDCFHDTAHIYQSLRYALDIADSNGVISEGKWRETGVRTLPLTDDIIMYHNAALSSSVTYTLNREGLTLLLDIVEDLRLVDVIPGFDAIAEKIRKACA